MSPRLRPVRLAAGERPALELFITDATGWPADMVADVKTAPFWHAMAVSATCLTYDADMTGRFHPRHIGQPVAQRRPRRPRPVITTFFRAAP